MLAGAQAGCQGFAAGADVTDSCPISTQSPARPKNGIVFFPVCPQCRRVRVCRAQAGRPERNSLPGLTDAERPCVAPWQMEWPQGRAAREDCFSQPGICMNRAASIAPRNRKLDDRCDAQTAPFPDKARPCRRDCARLSRQGVIFSDKSRFRPVSGPGLSSPWWGSGTGGAAARNGFTWHRKC